MPSRRLREPRLEDLFRTRSAAMRTVLETAAKVLEHDVSILICGESGTGKNYLAEALHALGPRSAAPFTAIECASIPPDLFESELLGHERGTFTDAHARKVGKLEAAGAGTVYFDEIASLTPDLQAKLLRAIQERRFTRLGGTQSVPFTARILASVSLAPEELLAGGLLRRDLYYRINVVTLTLPPLRERQEDVLPLARQFLRDTRGGNRRLRSFTPASEQLLVSYPWPGNLRELRNAVTRAALTETGEQVRPESLGIGSAADLVSSAARGLWTLDELEAHYIRHVLRSTGSNYSKAAELLGINRKTLLEKRRKYGIE